MARGMLDMVMDMMCTQHDCGYSTASPGWWCEQMVTKINLENRLEQVTSLIEQLSLDDVWKPKEQKKEIIPEGRKTLRRGVQSGWRRGKLEEVRRARTTSGTFQPNQPQEEKEISPEGGNINSSEKSCLRPESDKTNINLTASRSPVKELIQTFEKLHQIKNHGTSTQNERNPKVGNYNKLTESFKLSSKNEEYSNFPSNSQQSDIESGMKSTNKLTESSKITSKNEQYSNFPSISQQSYIVPSKQKQTFPVSGGMKPTSSRRVWTKLKSGLFGWKTSRTMSGPSKPSYGKLTNISKISTQTKIKNFEAINVTETRQVLPPKIIWGGGQFC